MIEYRYPQLNFVFTKAKSADGSSLMRAQQLHEISKRFLSNKLQTACQSMPEGNFLGRQVLWARMQKPGQTWFFTKRCVRIISPAALEILRKRSAGICFDHVDTPLDRMRIGGADLHVACSMEQKKAFDRLSSNNRLQGEVGLLLHNVDLAFESRSGLPADRLRTCYMGERLNTDIPLALTRRIDVLDVNNRLEFLSALDKIHEYNMHHALRTKTPRKSGVIKPFLKGFTAAALGANIITARDTPDAEFFLGEDYPYLLDDTTDAGIVSAYEEATEGFGGRVWSEALARMADLANKTGPRATASGLLALVKHLSGTRGG